MIGNRIVVPQSLQVLILSMIHEEHLNLGI